MKELGHNRDWQQCRVKTKNMKKSYRDVKELDAILGHRPATTPAVLLDTRSTSQSPSLSTQEDTAEGETNGK